MRKYDQGATQVINIFPCLFLCIFLEFTCFGTDP